MARGRLFPDEQPDELILCDPSVEVAAGAEVEIARELERDARAFRPFAIVLRAPVDARSPATSSPRFPSGWMLAGLRFGADEQIANTASPIPCEMFDPLYHPPALELATIAPGLVVRVRLVNASPYHRRVSVRLLGNEIVPRTDPAHAAMMRFLGK
jgi:hypothetical protein